MPPPVLKTSFLCFKCLGLAWTTEDTLVPLLTTEFAPLFGLRFTVPWLELELGVGLWGPPFLSSLLAVSDDPELTPEELQMKNKALLLKLNQNADYTCASKCPHTLRTDKTLWSKNFQNVKLRLDFVEIWSFYCHSDFMWNRILVNSNGPKILFLAIFEVLNFHFVIFEHLSSPKFIKNSNFRVSKIAKNDIFWTVWIHPNSIHVNSEWKWNIQTSI